MRKAISIDPHIPQFVRSAVEKFRGAMIPASDRQLEVTPCAEPDLSLTTSMLTLKNAGWGIKPNPSPKLKNTSDKPNVWVKPRIKKQIAASNWLDQIRCDLAKRLLPVFL